MRLGEWTNGKREAPEPLEGNVVATVLVGTIAWAALFVVQLPFYSWYADHDHTWWLWTCLTGAGLGVFGLWYVRRREAAIQAARARQDRPDRA
ncbi:DUF2530 domain-containing protein [Streptomyces litchfieldiae]|uniref:DUF2530 domain-containing protein n=1 Tax=Streptomyces litchfieldiae TaxID=3075543 RepID=A0ABU2MPF8_9ACTN|nr:DUF2530 domain-containing protein [Streptomyces sp. DSM 44938]MDT0343243.1 DUF2530 domain-containing protein [Streptomyces sp. DSM 44938]